MFKEYRNYIADNPQKLWFKAKLYGWGWTPATWQGWLVTLLYIVVIIVFARIINHSSPTIELISFFVVPFIILTIIFFCTVYKKGEKPRWQWGPKRDNTQK